MFWVPQSTRALIYTREESPEVLQLQGLVLKRMNLFRVV